MIFSNIVVNFGAIIALNGTPHFESDFLNYGTLVLPPLINFQFVDNQLILTWNNAEFGLQSAPDLSGTFTNIPSATSPFTNSVTGIQQFFRLISN